MRSAQNADRRLVVAGFRPIEAVLPRFIVLAAATGVAVLGVAVTWVLRRLLRGAA